MNHQNASVCHIVNLSSETPTRKLHKSEDQKLNLTTLIKVKFFFATLAFADVVNPPSETPTRKHYKTKDQKLMAEQTKNLNRRKFDNRKEDIEVELKRTMTSISLRFS